MKQNQEGVGPQRQESFQVGYFKPADAVGIVRLFHAVYGDGYPIRLFYDPEAIIAANEEGRYYSIVARTPSGEVIGADHLFRSSPCPVLYENGAGLVLKEYRNAGINNALMHFIYKEFVPSMANIQETWGEAVCYHPYIQKAAASLKHIWTAIEVALMPAETYGKEKETSERVATLNGFRCYQPKPHRLFLPAPYEQELRWIYSRLDDARDIRLSEAKTPSRKATQTELITFNFSGVARITVQEIGKDFPQCLDNLEKEGQAKHAVVFQVFVNLACPWVGEAVDELRCRGYFVSGAFPRWFDSDGFMMQRILCPPDFDKIILVADEAKQLLDIIRKDWKRTIS
jgi:hypothetical protein